MLLVETEKLTVCLRKQSWVLAFVAGRRRLAAALQDSFRLTVRTTFSMTKCPGKTVRARYPYCIKRENFFSASKNS